MHREGNADRIAIAGDNDWVTRVRGSHRFENNLRTRNHPEFRVKETRKLGDLGRIGESLVANALGSGGPKGSLDFAGNSRKAHTGFGEGLDGAITAVADVQLVAHSEKGEGRTKKGNWYFRGFQEFGNGKSERRRRSGEREGEECEGVSKDADGTGDSYCRYRGTRRERSDRQKIWRLRQHNFKTRGGEGRIERH